MARLKDISAAEHALAYDGPEPVGAMFGGE